MRYALWNNKGGVGKSFLTFVLGTEFAHKNPDKRVILVDMCPQANLSEIVLGGNGKGAKSLEKLLAQQSRKTIGGYFDSRIASPHKMTRIESDYLVQAHEYNDNMPENLWIIVGDPSLEIQAQVISQISGQTLPTTTWMNVHNWLKDLIIACSDKLGSSNVFSFIDCNPSFSAYTELSMMAAEHLIIPCSSDGSSARAIDNVGALLFGIGINNKEYNGVDFNAKAKSFSMALPVIHSVLLNRSTQYNKKASKAFGAMFQEIKYRVDKLKQSNPSYFVGGPITFEEVPDNHSVAIVCSHLGMPLYAINPGKYEVHDTNPQINSEPLDRYKGAVEKLIGKI